MIVLICAEETQMRTTPRKKVSWCLGLIAKLFKVISMDVICMEEA
jgi:hypothetical protein